MKYFLTNCKNKMHFFEKIYKDDKDYQSNKVQRRRLILDDISKQIESENIDDQPKLSLSYDNKDFNKSQNNNKEKEEEKKGDENESKIFLHESDISIKSFQIFDDIYKKPKPEEFVSFFSKLIKKDYKVLEVLEVLYIVLIYLCFFLISYSIAHKLK